jgi:polyhydroxyalkanoate synthesis regulator protein
MITIIKYPNRKYYLPKQGYITLSTMLDYIIKDKDFRVYDNIKRIDITKETLCQVLISIADKIDERYILDIIKMYKSNE